MNPADLTTASGYRFIFGMSFVVLGAIIGEFSGLAISRSPMLQSFDRYRARLAADHDAPSTTRPTSALQIA